MLPSKDWLMMSRHYAPLAICLSVAAAGCSNPLAPCEGRFDVSVRSTQDPLTASWLPACGINLLTVERRGDASSTVFVWSISTIESGALFGPQITLGQSVAGSTVSGSPTGITPGATYRVTVERVVQGDFVVATGDTDFDYIR